MDINEAFQIIEKFAFLSEENSLIAELRLRLRVFAYKKTKSSMLIHKNLINKNLSRIISLGKSNENLMQLIYSKDDFQQYNEAINFIKEYINSLELMHNLI